MPVYKVKYSHDAKAKSDVLLHPPKISVPSMEKKVSANPASDKKLQAAQFHLESESDDSEKITNVEQMFGNVYEPEKPKV